MEDSKQGRIQIDWHNFHLAFARDTDFHDTWPQSVYLDLETGDVKWCFECDSDAEAEFGKGKARDNAEMRRQIEETPDRYLEIPGLSHGDHHNILQEFLDSDWTDDEEQHTNASISYFGSIGGWIKTVEDESAVHGYFDYREVRTVDLASQFLRDHGIE